MISTKKQLENFRKREIAEHVIDLINAEQSLKHIHQFNCFLSDLYKVGFLMRETQSQTDIGEVFYFYVFLTY